jgi:hypothetical protein
VAGAAQYCHQRWDFARLGGDGRLNGGAAVGKGSQRDSCVALHPFAAAAQQPHQCWDGARLGGDNNKNKNKNKNNIRTLT